MRFHYRTSPLVCSREISIEIEDGKIKEAVFRGGCPGNLIAVNALVKGLSPQEAISRLSGIRCADKSTSCPDQLAIALKRFLELQDRSGQNEKREEKKQKKQEEKA